MVVDAGFHQTRQTEVVLNVNVKDRVFVNFTKFVPVSQQKLCTLAETVSTYDVESVTTICVLEIYVHLFF